jgi:predicted permease
MNWIANLFRRPGIYGDLTEEMRLHLEERTEQLMREGLSPREAAQAARRAFGNVTLLEERSREIWQWPTLESIWADVRFALRQLRKSPGFTLTVVASLTLGLGANTTIFTFVNALLLRPPAVADSGRLVEVMERNVKGSGIEGYDPLSYPGYMLLREHNHTLSGFAAFDGDPRPVSWSNGGQGQMVFGQLVSANFFSVLGIEPALGRAFDAGEEKGGQVAPVVVVSHDFWQHKLGGDPSTLGRAMRLNGTTYTVVGVAPPGFEGILIGSRPDFWAPLAMTPALIHDSQRMSSETSFWLLGVGRLKPQVTRSQAQADLGVLGRSPQPVAADAEDLVPAVFAVNLVPSPYRGYVAAFTGLLMAAVGLVLLIACANAANLVLARAMTRRRELAVRSALGAGRFRILRQALTESLLLSMTGGAGGLLLAWWAVPLLLNLKPATIPLFLDAPFDWRVFTFAFAASLISGIVFGAGPAWRASGRELLPALKDERQFAGPRRSRLRGAVVVAQITVCLVLLISAALCVRSLLNARSIDPGFSIRNVATARLDPSSLGYSDAQNTEFYRQLLQRVRALPGVASASLASSLPLGTDRMVHGIEIDGFSPPAGEKDIPIQTFNVAPGFFSTMGIPVLKGREFLPEDMHAGASGVVINEEMARRYWPGRDPLGLHLKDDKQTFEIVGVVKTGRYRSLAEDPQPFMYQPLNAPSRAYLVVRCKSDEQAALGEIRRVLESLDPNVVPIEMESMTQYMALPLFAAHTTGLLLAVFGAVALLLATIGLSGVVSYSVSQRTTEIGVRMALGADRGNVLNLILRQGMELTALGIALGLAVSFAATRVLSGLLYGIKPADPLTFISVSLFLAIVALLSCYLPARRAATIDPMKALRAE